MLAKWKIENVVLCDLNLNFQGQQLRNVSLSKMVRATTKVHMITFIDDDNRHRMTTLQLFYFMT